jgi:hypothetical protein
VLESQIARVNGSRPYLLALRDAYRGHVESLRRAGKEAEAEVYAKRLAILDHPGDEAPAGRSVAPARTETRPVQTTGTEPDARPDAKFRANVDDPFHPDNTRRLSSGQLVKQADAEFDQRRYAVASKLYQQAQQADATAILSQDRWAYCKIAQVFDYLSHPTPGGPTADALEAEVNQAVRLSPKMEAYAREKLLPRIRELREGKLAEAEPVAVAVRHLDGKEKGWEVAETSNFRIFHQGQKETAERVARAAEQARTAAARRWLGESVADWKPICEVYLHANAQDYSRATNQPATSPGHSTVMLDAGRIMSRRIDLRRDEPTLLTQRLPHETTHVVLAGQFGDRPLPRWADEGLAVLSEPEEEVVRYRERLQECVRNHQLFTLDKLLALQEYPEARRIDAFYCESVALAEFLLKEKDAKTLTAFLRDVQRLGAEAASQRHYGFADLTDMQQRFEKFALGKVYTQTPVADRGR